MRLSEAAILRIVYFLVFCCTASWLPVLADFCKSRGLSGKEISLVLNITPVMMFLVQPVLGYLSDKTGYKRSLILATGLSSVSYLGYLLAGGWLWLTLVTFFMALFYNAIQPLLDSMSLQLAGKNKSFSYGSLRIAGAAGWALTGIVTGQVIDTTHINMIFIISFISMFLAFVCSFFLHNDKLKKKAMPGTGGNVKALLRKGQLVILLVGVFLVSAGATAIWNFYSIYMKENGASATLVGYGLSLQGLCELPLFYFSALIIRKLGLKATLLVAMSATVIRLSLYSVIKQPLAALPIEILHGISWSLFWVACVEYVNRLVPAGHLAAGQSLLYAAYFGLGAVAGNLWTGYLYDLKMGMPEIFLWNALIVMGSVLLVAVLLKRPPAFLVHETGKQKIYA